MKKLNKWQTIKEFINRQELGAIINRKEIMQMIYNGPAPRTSSYGTTIDNYRRCLTILGILEHVSLGKYKLHYHIRDTLTASEVRAMAYGGYRSWFNDAIKRGEHEYSS